MKKQDKEISRRKLMGVKTEYHSDEAYEAVDEMQKAAAAYLNKGGVPKTKYKKEEEDKKNEC